jgi:hypothetical protein
MSMPNDVSCEDRYWRLNIGRASASSPVESIHPSSRTVASVCCANALMSS